MLENKELYPYPDAGIVYREYLKQSNLAVLVVGVSLGMHLDPSLAFACSVVDKSSKYFPVMVCVYFIDETW
jgi:hypothetical protein